MLSLSISLLLFLWTMFDGFDGHDDVLALPVNLYSNDCRDFGRELGYVGMLRYSHIVTLHYLVHTRTAPGLLHLFESLKCFLSAFKISIKRKTASGNVSRCLKTTFISQGVFLEIQY